MAGTRAVTGSWALDESGTVFTYTGLAKKDMRPGADKTKSGIFKPGENANVFYNAPETPNAMYQAVQTPLPVRPKMRRRGLGYEVGRFLNTL